MHCRLLLGGCLHFGFELDAQLGEPTLPLGFAGRHTQPLRLPLPGRRPPDQTDVSPAAIDCDRDPGGRQRSTGRAERDAVEYVLQQGTQPASIVGY